MSSFSERGYVIRETGPVYYTKDMDQTVKWFEDTLGWYYEIDEQNADNKGTYGCVYDLPREFENLHLAPFTGLHLFYGEPRTTTVAMMKVSGIDRLYEVVRKSGWTDITEVNVEPWGGKVCTVTTIDGCSLRFFE